MGSFKGRNIISTKDFSRDDLEAIFDLSAKIKANPRAYAHKLDGKMVALLFFEPSTRTRLSFDAAAQKLGCMTIGSAGEDETSILKGETLHDTVRIVAGYSDCIAIRHKDKGSAQVAVDALQEAKINVPVINAGDGDREHPTQAMLDLYTMKEEFEGSIDGLNIGITGDLKYSRTISSLTYALKHYDVEIAYIAPKELPLKEEVEDFLKKKNMKYKKYEKLDEVVADLDVLYVTRIQKERFPGYPDLSEYNKVRGVYRIDKKLIDDLEASKSELRILHPLPRVDEIAHEVDSTDFAKYFIQAENGQPVRMALLLMVLGDGNG